MGHEAVFKRRNYVEEKNRYLYPTPTGEALIDGLVDQRFSFVDPVFTRDMEGELDEIATGQQGYQSVVSRHYQRLDREARALGGVDQAISGATNESPATDEHGTPYPCPNCGAALRRIPIRKGEGHGQYFWGCSDYRHGCKATMDDADGKPVKQAVAPTPTDEHGKPYPCPSCGAPLRRIAIRRGERQGQYFWGCTDYRGGCKGTMDDNDGRPVPSRGRVAKEGFNLGDRATRHPQQR